jgi:hypothetical protein
MITSSGPVIHIGVCDIPALKAKMAVLIHAGMHKTGTTSIQNTLEGFSDARVEYIKWNNPNHSPLFALMCHTHPENYHLFKKRGWTRDDLMKRRAKAAATIRDTISSDSRTYVFSGEDISVAVPVHIENLRDVFADAQGGVQVLMYIRPPSSYLVSAFQTRLRVGGLDSFDLDKIWPRYRYRVEKFDQIFGRKNVILRPFHPNEFKGNNVVLDFADFLGIDIDPDKIVTSNETLSAEATALLYLQRKLGTGFGEPGPFAVKRNSLWFTKLDSIGSRRFRFSDSLLNAVVQRNRADVDWIEERMGRQLQDKKSAQGYEIETEQDLIDLAVSQKEAVGKLLLDAFNTAGQSQEQTLTRMLETIRDI